MAGSPAKHLKEGSGSILPTAGYCSIHGDETPTFCGDSPMGNSGQPLGKELGPYRKYLGVAERNAGLVESRVEDKMAVQEMTRQVTNLSREFSLCQATLQQLVCRELNTSVLV